MLGGSSRRRNNNSKNPDPPADSNPPDSKGDQEDQTESDPNSEDPSSGELEIRLTGYSKPTWKDLLPVQIVLFPFVLGKSIYRCVKPLSQEEQEQLICEKNGWTKEEFQEKKRLYLEYVQR